MRHLEDSEQIALFQWAMLTKIDSVRVSDYLFAIPNGGKRSKIEAARFKKMGVKAGVSDIFLPVSKSGFHGLWIELKAKNGKPTAQQLEWLNKMAENGYASVLCYGADAAIKTIKEYLKEQTSAFHSRFCEIANGTTIEFEPLILGKGQT